MMQIGMVGLGRMGANMVERLRRGGHHVVVNDVDTARIDEVARAPEVDGAGTLEDLVASLQPPRVVWVMVPSGDPTEQTVRSLGKLCAADDVIVDGGNSNYHDSMRRAAELAKRGVEFVDAGTSGGIWGLQVGYCLMVGGSEPAVARVQPALETLAPPDGFLHVGPAGAGHFVKMVHNGIEYGMLQAYAEGFEILHAGSFDLDLQAIAHLWNQGSVVRSWLLELAERAFGTEGNDLEHIRGWVADSGEGRWTVETAIDLAVPAPVIALSLMTRFRSRQEESYGARVIAALRNEFGGHAVKRED